jgi:hypothetical protein
MKADAPAEGTLRAGAGIGQTFVLWRALLWHVGNPHDGAYAAFGSVLDGEFRALACLDRQKSIAASRKA